MDKIPIHQHNGIDCNELEAKDALARCPQPAITKPIGGGTVDSEARTAINSIIDKLKEIGITL